MTDKQVQLNIATTASGAEDVHKLADEVRGLGAAGEGAEAALAPLAAKLEQAEAATKGLREAEAALKTDLQAAQRSLVDQRDALARLALTTADADKSADAYRESVKAAKVQILDARAAIREKADALQAAQAATRTAAAAERSIASELERAAVAYRQSGTAARESGTAQRDALRGIADQLRTLQSLAGAAIGGTFVGGLAADVGRTADAFANLQARIKIVTGDGPALEQAFQGVFDVASRTNTAVEETGTLFTRLLQAGKQIGLTSQQALALTETINQAVQVSGASAESSSAAITQLIQGLQSGVLRGEEFNSVMEQAPRLAFALADGLGVTTGELRKLAEAGRLTAATVIGALQGQSQALQAEFNQLPPTIGRAITNLSTEWTRYVGEVDKANGVSSAAASVINALARNLDTLGSLLFSAGKAAVAYQAIKLAQTFLDIGTAARTSATGIAAQTAAVTANTAATTANAAAQRAVGAAGAEAAVGVGRLASLLGTLKTLSLIGILTNLREIGTAIGEGAAKLAGYGKAFEEAEIRAKADAQTTRDNAAAKAALAQQMQQAAERALGLSDASKRVVAEFEGLRAKGESVSDALGKVSKSLELGNLQGITDAGTALDALAQRGQITGQQVRDALAAALKGEDLGVFRAQALAAFDDSEQGARRLQAAIDAIATESLRRAGTSADELRTGFSAAANSAINDVDALAQSLASLGLKGDDAARALTAALAKATDTAGTARAVDAVIARYEALGRQGLITGDQLAEGLDKARTKLEGLTPGIQGLDEALRTFGLKSRDELTRTAETFRTSFDLIARSTSVSLADKVRAFQQYRDAAIAANGGVESSEVKAREEMLRFQGAAIGAVKAVSDAMGNAGRSVDALRDRVNQTAGALDSLAERNRAIGAESQASDEARRNFNRTAADNTGFGTLFDKLAKGTLTGDDLALAQGVFSAAKNNLQVVQQNGTAVSSAGYRSALEDFNKARRALDTIQGPSLATPETKRTVTINLKGRQRDIGVASEADGDALVGLLRDLEEAAARS